MRITGLLLFILALPLAARSQDTDPKALSQARTGQARQLLERNPANKDSVTRGVALLAEAVTLDPANEAAYEEKARMELMIGKPGDAVATLNGIIPKAEKKWFLMLLQGAILESMNRTGEARQAYQEIIRQIDAVLARQPDSLDARLLRTYAELFLDKAAALKSITALKNKYPNDPRVLDYYRNIEAFNKEEYMASMRMHL